MANVMMATYTTCNDGKLMYICNKCHSNQKNPRNATYVVYQAPSYMATLLSTHLVHVQLLSFFNITLQMQLQNWSFTICQIIKTNLLNSPLLSWDGILNHNFSCRKNGYLIKTITITKYAIKSLVSNIQNHIWTTTLKK